MGHEDQRRRDTGFGGEGKREADRETEAATEKAVAGAEKMRMAGAKGSIPHRLGGKSN